MVAIWTNPSRDVKERGAHLFLDGRESHYSQTATRHGDSLSAEWGWFEFDGQACGQRRGLTPTERRWPTDPAGMLGGWMRNCCAGGSTGRTMRIPGPQVGHVYRELVGGPLDGLLVDVTNWSAEELADGVALLTELGVYGAGGRSHYGPRPADPLRWDWESDSDPSG